MLNQSMVSVALRANFKGNSPEGTVAEGFIIEKLCQGASCVLHCNGKRKNRVRLIKACLKSIEGVYFYPWVKQGLNVLKRAQLPHLPRFSHLQTIES